MKITPEQYDKIKNVLPVQRGNVKISNIDFLNAILYVAENGCKWRALPKEFGLWHTIYTRMWRWADNDVWPRVLEALKTKLLIEIDITALSLDSTSIEVHPDGMGSLKKRQAVDRQKSRQLEHENSWNRRRRDGGGGKRKLVVRVG